MGLSLDRNIDTIIVPFGTNVTEMQSYAQAIGGELKHRNRCIYLRTRSGGDILVTIDCRRPLAH